MRESRVRANRILQEQNFCINSFLLRDSAESNLPPKLLNVPFDGITEKLSGILKTADSLKKIMVQKNLLFFIIIQYHFKLNFRKAQ
jgi:hypothetical protein